MRRLKVNRVRIGGGITLCALLVLGALAPAVWGHTEYSLDIARLSSELRDDPDRVDLLLRRGRLFRFDGHPLASLADLNRADRLAPGRWDVVFERAITLAHLNHDDEADGELTRCLRLRPSFAAAYAERGYLRMRRGRSAQAIGDFSAALDLKPDIEWILARGNLQERAGDLAAAAEGYRDGLAKLEGAVLIRLALIRVETARGQYDEALALLDPVLKAAQIKTEWHLRRAEVLAAARRTRQADEELALALEAANRAVQRRGTAIHLVSRAKVLAAMHRTEDALADVGLAMRQSPKFRPAGALLGELQALSPNPKQADLAVRAD